jgi:hypothetical protein
MTTRKQAQRDRKRRVHGWESEAVDAPEPAPAKSTARKPTASAKPSSSKASSGGGSRGGSRPLYRDGTTIVYGRQRVPQPTWRRTLIRTAIFLPVMFIIVHFLFSSSKMSPQDELMLILGYAVVTVGVMHVTETWRYRRLDRQLGEQGAVRKKR